MANAKTVWVMAIVLSVASPLALANVYWDDGQIHNIDYTIEDNVFVDYEAPGMQTTVNLLDGGCIEFGAIIACEDSRINMLGGVIMTGLGANDRSQVNICRGDILMDLAVRDWSYTTMSGGWIGDDVLVWEHARLHISGGSVPDIYADHWSEVDISGGSVKGQLTLDDAAIVTIHGSDFAVDGVAFGYGTLTSIYGGYWGNEPGRHLTGSLASGQPIDNDFRIGQDAKIVLVPEPATVLLLGLGGLALLSRRRWVNAQNEDL